jgi:hypothetical protein
MALEFAPWFCYTFLILNPDCGLYGLGPAE